MKKSFGKILSRIVGQILKQAVTQIVDQIFAQIVEQVLRPMSPHLLGQRPEEDNWNHLFYVSTTTSNTTPAINNSKLCGHTTTQANSTEEQYIFQLQTSKHIFIFALTSWMRQMRYKGGRHWNQRA